MLHSPECPNSRIQYVSLYGPRVILFEQSIFVLPYVGSVVARAIMVNETIWSKEHFDGYVLSKELRCFMASYLAGA